MKAVYFISLVFLFSSCSYNITRYDYQVDETKHHDCDVLFKKYADLNGIDKEYLGSIKLDDNGFTTNCTSWDAKKFLIKEACALGANFINIIEEAYPSGGSSCYRCIAEFFKIENNEFKFDNTTKLVRDTIRLNNSYILKWEDFKGVKLDTNDWNDFNFNVVLRLKTKKVNFWTGNAKLEAIPVLYRDVSWIDKLDIPLEYFKICVDISRKHALILNKDLSEIKANLNNRSMIFAKLDQQTAKMRKEQIGLFKDFKESGNKVLETKAKEIEAEIIDLKKR